MKIIYALWALIFIQHDKIRLFLFTFTDCLLDKKILLLKSKCKVAVWAVWMWLSHPYPQNDCKIVLILNRGGNPNNITCCIIICKYEFHELRTTSIQIDSNYHMKGLCINFLCFIKRRSYVTAGGLYHRPNWNGPIKLGPTYLNKSCSVHWLRS